MIYEQYVTYLLLSVDTVVDCYGLTLLTPMPLTSWAEHWI